MPRNSCRTCDSPLGAKNSGGLCRRCNNVAKAVVVERLCKSCGVSFSSRAWKVQQGKALFCSRACVNQYQTTLLGPLSPKWQGGKDKRRGVGWKIAKQWALVRANECCEKCGASKAPGVLNVHHLLPYKFCKNDAEANSPGNLVVLCRSCHAQIHRLGEIVERNDRGQFIEGTRKVVIKGGQLQIKK